MVEGSNPPGRAKIDKLLLKLVDFTYSLCRVGHEKEALAIASAFFSYISALRRVVLLHSDIRLSAE